MAQSTGMKVVLIGAAILGGMYFKSDANIGKAAPAFSLPGAYGGRFDLDSFRGHSVLLVFWTTSCGICRNELPLLSRMEPEFRRSGIEILAVHLGGADDARNYLGTNSIRLTSLIDETGTVGHAYHVSGVPRMVLIGKDGKVKRSSAGGAGESELHDWIAAAGAA